MAFSNMMSNLGSSAKGMFTDGAGAKAVIFIPNPDKYLPDERGKTDPNKLAAVLSDEHTPIILSFRYHDVIFGSTIAIGAICALFG